jgi:hypothetical protein
MGNSIGDAPSYLRGGFGSDVLPIFHQQHGVSGSCFQVS